MKVVVQKVSEASVTVENTCVGEIKHGFVLLVGIEADDTVRELEKAADKIAQLRIFEDEDGKMNRSIKDVGGSILSISQFTLAADCRKGNRPSFIEAMRPEDALPHFNRFNEMLCKHLITVETGVFQAHMKVCLINDGPVTIVLNIKDGKVL